jgi:hypothetical protein
LNPVIAHQWRIIELDAKDMIQRVNVKVRAIDLVVFHDVVMAEAVCQHLTTLLIVLHIEAVLVILPS